MMNLWKRVRGAQTTIPSYLCRRLFRYCTDHAPEGSLSALATAGASSVAIRGFAKEISHFHNVYVEHAFYKSKSVIRMSPSRPAFAILETGDAILKRQGCVLLEFAPAIGTRKYDWNKKQVFALSISELGSLMGLRSNEGCEFFHDPHMCKSDAGKVRKTLKVEPKPDGSSYFFHFSIVDNINNVNEKISVLVLKAEFMIMKSAFNYIIPHLMGWHTYCNPHLKKGMGPQGESFHKGGLDIEVLE